MLTRDHTVDAIHAALDALEQRPRLGGEPTQAQAQPAPQASAMALFRERAESANSLLCVGLDPHAADIGTGDSLT